MQTDLLRKWDYLGILFVGKDLAIRYTPYFVHLRLGGVGYGGVLKEERGREAESGRANVQSLEHCSHCHLCCHQCHLCCHQLSYLSSLLSLDINHIILSKWRTSSTVGFSGSSVVRWTLRPEVVEGGKDKASTRSHEFLPTNCVRRIGGREHCQGGAKL